MRQPAAKDLFVLVADEDMKRVAEALFVRRDHLRIRHFEFEVRRHSGKDSGCCRHATIFLRPFLNRFRHCLVMFDHHGCGREKESREIIQQSIEAELGRNGWEDRAKVIVIKPELEAWVWGDISAASEHLGWLSGSGTAREAADRLRGWLSEQELWPSDRDKPDHPKKAMEEVMKEAPLRCRRRRSPRIFGKIAQSANMRRCRDPAFNELIATLRRWYPPNEHHRRLAPTTPEADNPRA